MIKLHCNKRATEHQMELLKKKKKNGIPRTITAATTSLVAVAAVNSSLSLCEVRACGETFLEACKANLSGCRTFSHPGQQSLSNPASRDASLLFPHRGGAKKKKKEKEKLFHRCEHSTVLCLSSLLGLRSSVVARSTSFPFPLKQQQRILFLFELPQYNTRLP